MYSKNQPRGVYCVRQCYWISIILMPIRILILLFIRCRSMRILPHVLLMLENTREYPVIFFFTLIHSNDSYNVFSFLIKMCQIKCKVF
jgi:hypothetical protein